jgi:elongation factor P
MYSTNDFKKGLHLEIDGQPWTIVSLTTQSPSARGQATLVKVRLKNALTGQVSDRSIKAGEKFKEADLAMRAA